MPECPWVSNIRQRPASYTPTAPTKSALLAWYTYTGKLDLKTLDPCLRVVWYRPGIHRGWARACERACARAGVAQCAAGACVLVRGRGTMRAAGALPRRTRRQCKEVGDRASGSLRATGPMPWSRQRPAPSTVPQQGVPASLGGRTRFHGGLTISQARATHFEGNL